MKLFKTEFGDGSPHPEILIWVGNEGVFSPDWLIEFFKSQVMSGGIFQPDETVQIGWQLIKMVSDSKGNLEVWEPSPDHVPIEWIRGATRTLRELMIQRAVCSIISVEPVFPNLIESGVIPEPFQGHESDFYMERDAAQGSDSGWLLWEPQVERSGSRHCSLFEMALKQPRIIPFLALPPGVHVAWVHSLIEITFGETTVSSNSNEFLQQLLESR